MKRNLELKIRGKFLTIKNDQGEKFQLLKVPKGEKNFER
jgi:hypothetical protein